MPMALGSILDQFRQRILQPPRNGDGAITAAKAYVDLSPIRAGIAQTLASSEYTSIARRLRSRIDADVVRVASTCQANAAQHAQRPSDRLKPIAGLLRHQLHSISTEQYIELLAWSASLACPGKYQLESPAAALNAIDCNEAEWTEQMSALRCDWRVVGGGAQMRELAQKIGQHRFKRRTRRSGEKAQQMKSG
jgi:hypothetical protein